jgi:peptidoglycan/xylan/chitin deacetylase (PgdA/CDA1 family)
MTDGLVYQRLKTAFLHASKWCGLFRLSRSVTRGGLRILCYHGFADDDLLRFRPSFFMSSKTFAQRLEVLRSNGYPVLPLEDALTRLDEGTLAPASTVITVDDALESFQDLALPLLKKQGLPVTTYVASYYALNHVPDFRLVVRYMLWKGGSVELDLSSVDPALKGSIRLGDPADRQQAEDAIIAQGEMYGSDGRKELSARLGQLLNVDYERLTASRAFHVVSLDEVRDLVDDGVDVQLHTHRHRLPVSQAGTADELTTNRQILEPIVGRALVHFCYPNGIWSDAHWPWLASLKIRSATTCDAGLNYRTTPRLGLRRILDAEDVPLISFEAEMSGFTELLRSAVRRVRSALVRRGGERLPG